MIQGNLIILRKENNETQKDLAGLLGISEDAYRNKERGISQFKLQEMFYISEHYNKSIEEIFLPRKTTKRGIK